MGHRHLIRGALLGLLPIAALAMQAAPKKECTPRLQGGWIRLPPMPMPMLAGFGTLENACAEPAAVVSASSPAFGEVSLHESRQVDGVNRMREVEELPLPAGGRAALRPGGLHLMLTQPKAALKEGAQVPVRFVLKDGRELQGTLTARASAP